MSARVRKSPGFWRETWTRFRRQWLASSALIYIIFLGLVALFAPAIAGTKPIVCRYKGHIYFPCLGYFESSWENPIFQRDGFRKEYTPKRFHAKDPQSWQIWPLVYQDPYRRVRADEWPGQPANPTHEDGRPSRYNWFGTNEDGVDVFRIKEEVDGVWGIRGRRTGHPGKFVAQHQDRIANGQFGVHDYAARSGHAHSFLGVEDLLVIIDCPGRTLADDCGSNGMESFRNRFYGAHSSSLGLIGLGAQGG